VPGVTNAWVMPIKTRIDMLATGIKTPVGVKIAGPDLNEIERIGQAVERAVTPIRAPPRPTRSGSPAGATSISPGPARRGALGLNVDDINRIAAAAIGGINLTQTVEGLERYPVNLRFPREQRDSVQELRELPIVTPTGAQVPLAQVAEVVIADGAPMLKSENAASTAGPSSTSAGRSRQLVEEAQAGGARTGRAARRLFDHLVRPVRVHGAGAGAAESGRATDARDHLRAAVPDLPPAPARPSWSWLSLPFALVGGFWLIFLLDYNLSVAVGGRLHRAGRRRRRVRRGDAGLSRQRAARALAPGAG
jgi:Cu(I)/Ag(I) efflux system membrane protein CusA/SilA